MGDKKNVDRTLNETAAAFIAKQLINETLWTTPLPQATSTANRDIKKGLSPVKSDTSIALSPKVDRYMAELLKEIDSMTEEIKHVHTIPEEGNRNDPKEARQSVASIVNSSLGILEQNDLKGFESLEDKFSLCESVFMQDLSKRFENELDQRSSNLGQIDSVPVPRLSCNTSPSKHTSPKKILSQRKNLHCLRPFDGYDKISMSSEEFLSDGLGVQKILEDERKFEQDIPNTGQNLSLSGIIESDKATSDKLSMSSFMRQGSYPLGSLGEDVCHERPTFGQDITSPTKKNLPFPIFPPPDGNKFCELDQSPRKHIKNFLQKSNSEDICSTSTVSSVASVSQIAEIVSNLAPDATPHTLLQNIISKAKSKKFASILEVNETDTSPKTNVSNFQEQFLNFCDSFMTKSSISKENKGNVCTSISYPNRPSEKKNLTSLMLVENDVSDNSTYETENDIRYSPNSNSSIVMTGYQVNQSMLSRASSNESYQKSSVIDGNDGSELYVCVATSVRMDFDVMNKTNNKQYLKIQKCIFVDGIVSTHAALIELDTDNIDLEPHSTKSIGVLITPLVAEAMDVKLEVQREDCITKEVILDTVTGQVIGEYPEIALLSDSIISFDPLHEGCTTDQTIMFQNMGKSEVPLTLLITKNGNSNAVFSFNGKDSLDVVIRPGDILSQKLNCCGVSVNCLTDVKGIVEIKLKTFFDFFKLPELFLLPICVVVAPCALYMDHQELIIEIGESKVVPVQNASPIIMSMSLIPPVGIFVQPTTMQLQPGQKSSFSVSFSANNIKGYLREGSRLRVQILPNGKSFELSLAMRQKAYMAIDFTEDCTPQMSRAASPMSPGSIESADGNMLLECTHTSLVWGSHQVHSKHTKSCTLRNRSLHKEKLLISIIGSNNCFKLTKDKKKLEDRLQISLQPMESTTLNVVMIPTHAGAFTSSLYITRINNANEKKVLALYGYGGKAKLVPQGVSRDPDQHMWIYLDSNTLSSSFIIKNVGDAPAFVKISQGIEAIGISISPPEALIQPASEVRVEIRLTTTPERLEYLLSEPGDAAVNVTRLILTLGDESTRHRLNRLYRKLQVSDKSVNSFWKTRMMALNGLFSETNNEDVYILRDPISSLETLWHEGIKEWNIGVIAERSLLENICLDSTIEFVDLENTILEETVITTCQPSYSVIPPALQFSIKNKKEEITIKNMTTRSAPFIIEPTYGLLIIPSEGCLPAVSSLKIQIIWEEGNQPPLQSKIKIVFASTEIIEVPISWKMDMLSLKQ